MHVDLGEVLRFVYSPRMSFHKYLCAASLCSFVALVSGLMVVSEVRAGSLVDHADDLPVAASVDPSTLEQASAFAGNYQFVGGQKERDAVDAAIETSVDALSPLLRNIGRSRLVESNVVPKNLSIRVEGNTIEALFDGEGFAAGLDGTPVRATNKDGEKVKVSYKLRGGKLSELIDNDKGDRQNTFKLSDDGKTLTVKVTVSSSHLPVPVDYKLTFKKK